MFMGLGNIRDYRNIVSFIIWEPLYFIVNLMWKE
jgi:hypothetical protein